MKMKIAALALLLAAGAAPAAFAQDQDHGGWRHGGDRGDRPAGQPHAGGGQGEHRGGERPAPQAAPQAQLAPQAQPAPQAQAAPPQFQGRRGGGEARPGGGEGPRWVHVPQQPEPGFQGGRHRDGAEAGGFQGPGRGGPAVDQRRFDGGRRPDVQGVPQVQGWGGERRGDGQAPRADRRFDGGRGQGWDRNRGGDRNWSRDGRANGPHWSAGRYPHSYSSHRRFHIRPYVFPYGFYGFNWGYGQILPQAFFVDDYVLEDWWNYDLPAPPPGYDWVRVGDDAVLVDEYSGRIVQVVRALFW